MSSWMTQSLLLSTNTPAKQDIFAQLKCHDKTIKGYCWQKDRKMIEVGKSSGDGRWWDWSWKERIQYCKAMLKCFTFHDTLVSWSLRAFQSRNHPMNPQIWFEQTLTPQVKLYINKLSAPISKCKYDHWNPTGSCTKDRPKIDGESCRLVWVYIRNLHYISQGLLVLM